MLFQIGTPFADGINEDNQLVVFTRRVRILIPDWSRGDMKSTPVISVRNFIAGALLAIIIATGFGRANCVLAREAKTAGQAVKAPQTAQEHKDRAEQYRRKAVEYRQEAADHRKMLADYSKGVAKNPKDTSENPYVKKMRLHCEKYAKAAEELALEAEEMAKYHTMRAKESEGK